MVINFHYVLNLNCHLCMPKSIIKRMGQLQSVKYIYIFLFNYYIYLSYTFFILLIYYYYISCLSMTPWTQHCYRVTSSPFLALFFLIGWYNLYLCVLLSVYQLLEPSCNSFQFLHSINYCLKKNSI